MPRRNILRKSYVMPDGNTRRSAKVGAEVVRFEVLKGKDSDGNLIVAQTIDFRPDSVSEDIRYCAMLHGFSQKIGDEAAGADGKATKAGVQFSPAFVASLIEDMIADLTMGAWVEEGEGTGGSGNVTILFEAICRAFTKNGKEVTDEVKAKLRTLLSTKEARDKQRAVPQVKAEIEAITLERQQARAAKAAEAAAKAAGDSANTGLEDLFAGLEEADEADEVEETEEFDA